MKGENMRKLMTTIAIVIAMVFTVSAGFTDTYVNGYYRKDGTYVNGHHRSSSNGTVTDNYSFKGNTNPYTGKTGSNYYRKDSSSPYYNGGSSNSFGGSETPLGGRR